MPRKNRHLRTRFPTKTRSFVMEKMGPREGGGGGRGPADFFFRCVGRGFPGGAVSRSISPYSALSSCTNCTGWLIIHPLLRLAHPLPLRCESHEPIPTVEHRTANSSGGAQDPTGSAGRGGGRAGSSGATCSSAGSVGGYTEPSAAIPIRRLPALRPPRPRSAAATTTNLARQAVFTDHPVPPSQLVRDLND